MATEKTIDFTKVPKRSMSKNNIPGRNTPARKNFNPVGINDMSVSDDGVVTIQKGGIFVNTDDDAEGVMLPVVVLDEFDNFMEITRNSNIEDVTRFGVYINNQGIKKIASSRTVIKEGKPVERSSGKKGDDCEDCF